MVDRILEKKRKAEQDILDNQPVDEDEYGGENTVSESDDNDHQSVVTLDS